MLIFFCIDGQSLDENFCAVSRMFGSSLAKSAARTVPSNTTSPPGTMLASRVSVTSVGIEGATGSTRVDRAGGARQSPGVLNASNLSFTVPALGGTGVLTLTTARIATAGRWNLLIALNADSSSCLASIVRSLPLARPL